MFQNLDVFVCVYFAIILAPFAIPAVDLAVSAVERTLRTVRPVTD